jgi:D-alanyl-D-alanine carboxypeptidase
VTGLSANNISSPRDLLKIFVKTTNNPTLKPILGKTKYDFQTTLGKKTIKQNVSNTNPLLGATNKTYKVIASKTGYIDEGGANLAMLIESKNDKKQYVIITMGDTDYTNRFVEPDKIANWIATSDVASLIAKK